VFVWKTVVMNVDQMQKKLIAAARKMPPRDEVPHAFQKRIMARIGRGTPLSGWALWARPLWGAAVSCVAITLLCGVWSLTARHHADYSASFSQDFERVIFSSVNQHLEDAW
jgi:hypothetical protein